MTATSKLILAVDDSEELRDFYLLALELAGYSVVLAADGCEALKVAREVRPDVIITDVSMPVMDGLELLTRLRSDLAPPLPPILVCSGFDMAKSAAMSLGAFRFLRKPFEREDLIAAVVLALQGQTVGDESMAREKERLEQARERASAAAGAALRDIDFVSPAMESGLGRFAQWIADYFGFGTAALAFLEGADLRVRAASHGSVIAAGTLMDGRTLYSSGVLPSGASLVISDAAASAFAGERARQYGIRSFIGVPILAGGIPVGSICLFDAVPRAIAAEDLQVLEELGRTTLAGPGALPDTVAHVGAVQTSTFRHLLAAELLLHHRQGGSLDLAFVEYAPGRDLDEVLAAIHGASPRSRLGVAGRGSDAVALFKRAGTTTGASNAIGAAIGAIAGVAPLRAAGWISLGVELPSPSVQELIELARGALGQAHAGRAGTIERLELKREPWRGVHVSSADA
jgi:CheY-like chemotaxis protein